MQEAITNPTDRISRHSISAALQKWGCAPVPASYWHFLHQDGAAAAGFVQSWDRLLQDEFMGDHGTYRFRRYTRLRLLSGQLSPLDGNSIHQLIEHNPLNGGVTRTYLPVEESILANPVLEQLILNDADLLGLPADKAWAVGIHQVRIVTSAEQTGLPTPEGIHIDAEMYTVQHLIGRKNVEGGCFSAYDQDKKPILHWLQLELFDSVFFLGTTWHSATPIRPRPADAQGHRDILLIDFEPL